MDKGWSGSVSLRELEEHYAYRGEWRRGERYYPSEYVVYNEAVYKSTNVIDGYAPGATDDWFYIGWLNRD